VARLPGEKGFKEKPPGGLVSGVKGGKRKSNRVSDRGERSGLSCKKKLGNGQENALRLGHKKGKGQTPKKKKKKEGKFSESSVVTGSAEQGELRGEVFGKEGNQASWD